MGKRAAGQALAGRAVERGMAGISVGEAKTGRRSVDHELPLVPFIDFMVCLIAFLMVTAVWTQMSRINATGNAPGGEHGPTTEPPKELHVTASQRGFELRWQQGKTVLETQQVPRVEVKVGNEPRFPGLTEAITTQWNGHGVHRAESDRQLDRAVLHVPNDLPFSEIVAVLDALHAPRRGKSSAFDVAFAAN
jgi:biopolymer transport protein ExbD